MTVLAPRDPAVVRDDRRRIVPFGDSTTAPRGALAIHTGLLEKELPAKGVEAAVVNAGVGGANFSNSLTRSWLSILDGNFM